MIWAKNLHSMFASGCFYNTEGFFLISSESIKLFPRTELKLSAFLFSSCQKKKSNDLTLPFIKCSGAWWCGAQWSWGLGREHVPSARPLKTIQEQDWKSCGSHWLSNDWALTLTQQVSHALDRVTASSERTPLAVAVSSCSRSGLPQAWVL